MRAKRCKIFSFTWKSYRTNLLSKLFQQKWLNFTTQLDEPPSRKQFEGKVKIAKWQRRNSGCKSCYCSIPWAGEEGWFSSLDDPRRMSHLGGNGLWTIISKRQSLRSLLSLSLCFFLHPLPPLFFIFVPSFQRYPSSSWARARTGHSSRWKEEQGN